MNKTRFKRYLLHDVTPDGQPLAERAIATRLRWAQEAEDILVQAHIGQTLDDIVRDDDAMREALLRLRSEPRERSHAPRQNALRKYYRMIRGRDFPRLARGLLVKSK